MAYSQQHLDRLRLRHLRLLELIDEQGSLRAVGAVLNLTQPAVSQMVKDLEFAFGARLVDRSVRGVILTAAGRLALQRARSGLATFDQLADELNTDQTLTLRVGTNSAMMFNLIPAVLKRLETAQSGLQFRLQTGLVGDMVQGLTDGELDCYVGRIDWDQMPLDVASGLKNDPLMQTDLVVICPSDHPMASRRAPLVRDLVDCSWVLPSEEANNRIAMEAGMRNAGAPPLNPAIEVAADPSALINLALELNMLTCVPRSALDSRIAQGAICVLDLPDLRLPKIHIGFVTLAGHENMSSLQQFRQVLIETASDMPDSVH